ncbi:MAG: DNA helicase RecG [Spirochaetae bacterium HGW-Spirochaetae-4]|nr:MAG: DNA helicase RecG [Spirochaetae bacterium HGW-Spirochaetae-8]PKL22111.1 MAG: DNA helicase RecG [Spirochaetae bacterium HGW-Spirochaetae-4]
MYVRQLIDPITSLKGVGKHSAESYENLGVRTLGDLLLLAPRTYENRSVLVPLGRLEDGEFANTVVEVVSHGYFGGTGKRTLKVIVKDISDAGDGRAALLCFGRNFLERVFRIGSRFYLYGQFQRNFHELQSSQFEMLPLQSDGSMPGDFGKLLAIYPLSGGLSQRIIRRDVTATLARTDHFAEELPSELVEKHQLLPINTAIRALHQPNSLADAMNALRTLAFIELFYLLLMTRRKNSSSGSAAPRKSYGMSALQKKFISLLPFSLTKDQGTVLDEICAELMDTNSMNRLLQGDVGSGKTLVAWISALQVIEGGEQVAFMAPTELLARQHAEKAAEWLEPLGIRLAFLTGSVVGKSRKLLLEALSAGHIDIIIGTHALFSPEVTFSKLRYIIIDEQHRFGVVQRVSLLQKGRAPDVLMMTATPIPRTLALTVFGDLNISTIRTMPEGRLPVTTYLVANESRERMYAAVGVEFSRGHQAYFVYPRIDDRGESSLRDVETMFQLLTTTMYPGVPAALIHSRLPEEEKVSILTRFRKKELSYLVSTSVVEVGIDIPNATCMVIEHAERFGLSALHQLRGRVGRSDLQSYCFLVYERELGEDARKRLMVMKESNDGFHIAEQDLLIRGPGEVAGTRQSGFLKLRFANLTDNFEMIELIRDEIDGILRSDPGLVSIEHAMVRDVLINAAPFDDKSVEN